MKKKKAIIINLVVLVLILMLFMAIQGAAFTAKAAHKKQERTVNYGPSETIAIIAKDNKRFFLAKFRDYYSCDAVKRGFLGLWYGSEAGSPWGIENKKENLVNYGIKGERDKQNNDAKLLAVYGIINQQKSIATMEIEVLIQNTEEEFITRTITLNNRDTNNLKNIDTNNKDTNNKNINNTTEASKVSEKEDTSSAIWDLDGEGGIYKDMFLGFIEQEDSQYYYVKKITAYDQSKKLIFEEIDENAIYIEENKITY